MKNLNSWFLLVFFFVSVSSFATDKSDFRSSKSGIVGKVKKFQNGSLFLKNVGFLIDSDGVGFFSPTVENADAICREFSRGKSLSFEQVIAEGGYDYYVSLIGGYSVFEIAARRRVCEATGQGCETYKIVRKSHNRYVLNWESESKGPSSILKIAENDSAAVILSVLCAAK